MHLVQYFPDNQNNLLVFTLHGRINLFHRSGLESDKGKMPRESMRLLKGLFQISSYYSLLLLL